MVLNPFDLSDQELEIDVRNGVLFEALGPKIWEYPNTYRLKLIRYILYLYDKGSDLRRYFPDLTERKKICAELAGLDFTNHVHEAKAKEFYLLSHPCSRLSMVNFIKHQDNVIWGLYWSNSEHLFKLMEDVSKGFSDFSNDKGYLESQKIKSQLLELAEQTLGRIRKYELDLFQGDDVARDLAAKTRKGSFPEDIATTGNVY